MRPMLWVKTTMNSMVATPNVPTTPKMGKRTFLPLYFNLTFKGILYGLGVQGSENRSLIKAINTMVYPKVAPKAYIFARVSMAEGVRKDRTVSKTPIPEKTRMVRMGVLYLG